MFNLEGKVALITGATGGIGSAIATTLHEHGAHVVLTGTRELVLQTHAEMLGDRRASYVVANLSSPEEADTLIARAEEAAGAPVDILINNAGLTRDNLAIRMKDEEWDQVINLDLSSPFRLCRAALKGMLRKRKGRIVNIASIVGATGNPGQANYSAAKAGLIGMSKSLAQEVGSRGVTVNVIAPGFIDTPMTSVLTDAQKEKLLAKIPLGTLGEPKDIAAAALYLCSDEARWVTGAVLHVNGGMAML
ncbi:MULTISPECIES: 3-oxoacyl-[acyl-carrier-protein] reductase [Acetobacter]|uniref:3-oxoacyl-[acyl-carrier-protein] reductase n=1 Tax=Acetobacter TaxID=434 RepID=UPI000A35D7F5|nr:MULTISPECIES: 3-oxoacyl-[acyl-carrier-protein] reductase [Acetobacter]MBS1002753.1 3-oxoacyl-[acyl-carrier-protein] reductase [Acetobacter thailandicus]OUI88885.1 3-oxoacyl-ACP synthase [Acetobacter sp. DmW_043]OUJ11149.1 3-oxoacyl-ACP synthase [Acetobacter sp. DsW_059]